MDVAVLRLPATNMRKKAPPNKAMKVSTQRTDTRQRRSGRRRVQSCRIHAMHSTIPTSNRIQLMAGTAEIVAHKMVHSGGGGFGSLQMFSIAHLLLFKRRCDTIPLAHSRSTLMAFSTPSTLLALLTGNLPYRQVPTWTDIPAITNW